MQLSKTSSRFAPIKKCFQMLFTLPVHSVCENGRLLVCYRPHWDPPYATLAPQLKDGSAEIRLQSSTSPPHCKLEEVALFDSRAINAVTNLDTDLWRTMLIRLSSQMSPSVAKAVHNSAYCVRVDLNQGEEDAMKSCGVNMFARVR